jgi:hypothetical protein
MAKNIRRFQAPTVAANHSERRIIALENFMLGTHLRGKEALIAFDVQEKAKSSSTGVPPVHKAPSWEDFIRNLENIRGY